MYKLKTKWFHKWAKKQKLSDKKLLVAIEEIDKHLASINLGGGLYKVRVASQNMGKRSSYRTIIVYRKEERAVLVYGFMKKEQANLTKEELKNFKILAKDILALEYDALDQAIEKEVFVPIGEKDER